MLDSRLKKASQMKPSRFVLQAEQCGARQELRMDLLWTLPVPWAPDALELVYVLATIFLSLGIMVAFGAWWSR
jgi:hypothetical protein